MDRILISLLCLVFGYLALFKVDGAYTATLANNLYTALNFGYNSNNRPSETVNVSVTLTLDSINHVDFDKKLFSGEGWISSTWQDSAFTWTPDNYGDIEYLFLTKTDCWKPTLIIDNELSSKDVLNDDNLPMRVKYDNTVTWDQPRVFSVYCDLDTHLFPFDEHTCSISVGTVTYDMTTVLLMHGGSDVITRGIDGNSEWAIKGTSLGTQVRTDSTGLFYTNLVFNVELQRKCVWYVVNILVPWIVTSFLGLVVFFIPVQSGEKMVYTSSVLVVNVILLGISSYFLPTSAESVPVLGTYMASNVLLNAVEILLAVISIRIHNRDSPVSTIPLGIKSIVRKVCLRSRGSQTQEIADLTSNGKNRSHTLKSNKIGPSPEPTISGYQRMGSGADSSPSVDPELDGRTNVPSNSRYRPSSFTYIRTPSQLQDRSTSHSQSRPMSWKSTAGIHIRENSFVSEELRKSCPTEINTTPTRDHEHVIGGSDSTDVTSTNQWVREAFVDDVTSANQLIREPVDRDVTSGEVVGIRNAQQKEAFETSERQAPVKTTSFRSTCGADENQVTWPDVAYAFDIMCFVVMFLFVVILTVVTYPILIYK